MPEIKLDAKVRAAVAEALKPYSDRLYRERDTELTIVATLSPVEWKETFKTDDEMDFLEASVKAAVTDAEVVTGPHKEAAEKAAEAARTERETAGTLLEGAFDDQR